MSRCVATGPGARGGHEIFTTGMKRRAFQEAHRAEADADDGAMRAQRLDGVVRTGRGETAAAGGAEENREGGRERALIEADEHDENGGGQARDSGQKGGRALRHGRV